MDCVDTILGMIIFIGVVALVIVKYCQRAGRRAKSEPPSETPS